MKPQSEDKPVKKRATQRIYKELVKEVNEKCNKICEEVERSLTENKPLEFAESK